MSKCNSKYDWCSRHPEIPMISHVENGENITYCLFHAPKDAKIQSLEKFNKLISDFIKNTPKEEQCILTGTIFPGELILNFKNEIFILPPIVLAHCEFYGRVNFEFTHFSGRASMSHAVFFDEAIFHNVNFREGADFNHTLFQKRVDLSYSTFKNDSYFSGASFQDKVDLRHSTFHERVLFLGNIFENEVDFSQSEVTEKTIFDSTNLTQAIFCGVDLQRPKIINCIWPIKYSRQLIYDEVCLFRGSFPHKFLENDQSNRKSRSLKNLSIIKNKLFPNKKYLEEVLHLYRTLKARYKDEYNEVQISNWHYGEKEIYRKKNLFRRFLGVSFFYWLSSGYGERPIRAFLFLIFLVVLASFLTEIFVQNGSNNLTFINMENFFDFKKLPDLILTTLQIATFQKENYLNLNFDATRIGVLFNMMIKIVIPLQATLFGLALRNHFRR